MKKLKIILALCALTTAFKSQNSFGTISYPHANSFLSSGTVTSVNPGFLMAGSQLTLTSGYNFTIDRMDIGGVQGANSWNFQRGYNMTGAGPNCTGAPSITNCIGVSVIEKSFGPYSPYALAGAMDRGCFFATLDNGGNVIIENSYIFPITPTHISKPLITQSAVYADQLYIVGSYDGIMYILRVDTTGAIKKQYVTDLGASVQLQPLAILESPYGNQDLTIVGVYNSNSSGQDGFFYQIANTLAVGSSPTVFNRYNITSGNNSNNVFTSLIAESQNSGFLIGGGSVGANSSPGFGWMIQVNATGSVNWSTVINGNYGNGKIYGVVERYSVAIPMYEYFGACAINGGIDVYKLDNNGVPFSAFNIGNDEFLYSAGSSSSPFPVNMTFRELGYGLDEGLHIYGDLDNTGPGNHYFVEAYFNGVCSCEQTNMITSYDQTSPTVTAVNNATGTALNACPSFTISSAAINPYNSICGPFPSVVGGSNSKPIPLGIGTQPVGIDVLDVYPNPVSGKMTISYSIIDKSKVNIELLNGLGQHIKTIKTSPVMNAGNYKTEIDFDVLNIESGIYFLKSNINGTETKQKIIYIKE